MLNKLMDSNEKKNKKQKRKYIIISIITVIALAVSSFVFLYLDYDGTTVPGTASFWVNFIILVILCILFVAALGFLILEKHKEHKKRTTDDSSKHKTPIALCVLYYAAALLTPNIFLFILYNRNHIQIHMPFNYVIIWAGVFTVASLAIFFFLRFIICSLEARLVITTLFWGAFWLFGSMNSVAQSIVHYTTHAALLLMLATIFIALAGILLKFQTKLPRIRAAFTALAIYLCVMFIFNAYSGIRNAAVFEQADSQEQSLFRTDFNINPSLPSPDIYWFAQDGMMSFEAVENLFSMSFENERYELESRGFVIYDDAKLNISSSVTALVALFSPGFYDDIFGDLLAPLADIPNIKGMARELWGTFSEHGLDFHEAARNNETFYALMEADYLVIGNAFREFFDLSPFNLFYSTIDSAAAVSSPPYPKGVSNEYIDHSLWVRLQSGDLGRLLAATTPLTLFLNPDALFEVQLTSFPIPDYTNQLPSYSYWVERQIYANLIDIMNIEQPKFVFTDIDFTAPHRWREYLRYYSYPEAFEYNLSVIFNVIDMVLSNNPNAVIVLQSDHGIAHAPQQNFMYEQGYSPETIADLQRSVFSAVRIPEQYGGLNAPLEPRNIARELVNRFVGQNYELLP